MESTLKNMVAVLFGITLVASAGVGVVNMITAEPIALSKQAATTAALTEVLPSFDETTSEELTIDEMPITVYTATKGGVVAGYAVQTMTKQGFSGTVRLMVGFDTDGRVVNINVLEQTETPGLGTKMCDEGNPLLGSVKGQRLEEKKLVDGKLAVRKDGGDVDALTAATISSRAYVDAVNRAWMAYKSVATGTPATDVASGASQQTNNEPAAQEGGQNE
ncbi:RnfABCDGE type electron transport complex subunit G [uncultured Alistipes sp.]|jgi:electron transport complex protein RnfG|uniref:RnfABCDGE type electron transport complex subunit G n=1 Tax=uncultured Alistipes sp. TaxID=538949 RepID=UPI0025EF3866|nr:RnfABCDGE type electron transport complex subunit G [uncultured Alistipes sp.]